MNGSEKGKIMDNREVPGSGYTNQKYKKLKMTSIINKVGIWDHEND